MKNYLFCTYYFKLLFILIVLAQTSVYAQPAIQWENTIGGPGTDGLTTVLQTTDGGYMLCGSSDGGAGSDKSSGTLGGNGEDDIWIVKISADGTKQWDKTIQGLTHDQAADMIQTSDGGYIIAANSRSGTGADKTDSNKGFVDYWIIKLDENGVKQWDRTLGGSKTENAATIRQTSDGGYIIGGSSDSDAGLQKSMNSKGGSDYWVVKLSPAGIQEWDRTFGGVGLDNLRSMEVTGDNGFIIGGSSNSIISGDKSQDTVGRADYWIIKLASDGSKQWDQTIGSATDDQLFTIIQTMEGGYMMTGTIDFSLPYEEDALTVDFDTWVVKVSANGTREWDKIIGAGSSYDNYDNLKRVRQQSDGSYILAGYSRGGIGKDKTESSYGQEDYWLFKLDRNGGKIWDKIYAGRDQDILSSFQITSDGGYILAGSSNSDKEYDKSEDMKGGFLDYWVIKLAPEDPLPVTLKSFSATKENTTTLLTWETTAETNSENFEIEHSLNAKSWNRVGTVNAKGESNVLQSYQFNHTNPVNGENYYRLKMIDTDGTFTYSRIGQVKFDLGFEVLVYPNPVTESIHLQAPDWSKVRCVQILNNQGKRLYSSGDKPVQEVSVKVFKPGLHFVRLTFADGTEISRKLAIGQ